MSKRSSVGLGVGRKAKRRRRHFYVVMDDGEGYAVRKFDLSPDFGSSDDDTADHQLLQQRTADVTEQRLPRAVIGLDSLTSAYFAAIGTKIMVTHGPLPDRAAPIVFDVRTRRLNHGPRPSACPRNPIYLPLGDKLVSIDAGSTELLRPPPNCSFIEWSWDKLPEPPFKCSAVTSYAAHPDGRTVFFSIMNRDKATTFTLDTESEQWKRHGEWMLPFSQQAHFDPELDAWVGLSGYRDTRGYLCSSDVPPSLDKATSINKQRPAWKLGKEKMFGQDPAEEHTSAILAYMGRRSRFCLVQCFSVLDEDYDDIYIANKADRPRRHLLRLTSFSLKYDKNGDLQASSRRQVRCYKLPDVIAPIHNDLQAFWM